MLIHEPYIKHVKIQNYRSLQDVSVSLNKGLNVIIGENGAGKSNFLKFLDNPLTGSLMVLAYGQNDLEKVRDNINYTVEFEYYEGDDKFQLHLKHGFLAKHKSATPQISIKEFKNGKLFNNFSESLPLNSESAFNYTKIRMDIARIGSLIKPMFIPFGIPENIAYITTPGKVSLTESAYLVAEEPKTDYLTSFVSPLFSTFETDIEKKIVNIAGPRKDQTERIREIIFSWFNKKKRESEYVTLLKEHTPISDIKLSENINFYETEHNTIIDNIVLNFKVNNDWVPWSYLSHGTIRLFHIITEVLFNDSNIFLIEEPELGLHPHQLFKLMDFFKEQAEKKQIIISTHSPISLDAISPDELDQIIIAKMTKHGTTMQHLNSDQTDKAKAYITKVGNLSAYWLHSDLEQ